MAHGPGGHVSVLQVVVEGHGSTLITGTADVALAAFASSASGAQSNAGGLGTLSNFTSTASGTVTGVVGASFNGTTSYIESTTGTDLSLTGAVTVAWMGYWGADADDFGMFVSITDTDTTRFQFFRDINTFIKLDNGTTTRFANTSMAEGNFYIIIWTKATGTATPRLHYTADGTNWTHADGDGTMASFTAASTTISLGAERKNSVGTAKGLTQEMATLGIWAEDTDNAGCAAMSDFALWMTKTNRQFFTGSSLVSGGTMVDKAGSNSETGRANITAGVQVVPTWFTHFPIIDVTSTSAVTLDALTSSASGTVSSSGATGTVAVTLANFTSTATGTEDVTGTVAKTLENFTSTATGTETITGTVAVTLANFVGAATSTETITGTVARTLANFTGAATGTETFTGTVARTLANFTSSASGAVGAVAASGFFPTTVSANGRYLRDQSNNPYMIHGDTAWEITTNVSLEDMAVYLDDRVGRGVNAVIIEAPIKDPVNSTGADFYGHLPFTGTAFQSSLNEAYWANVDAFLQHAGANGVTVFFWMAYLGFNHGTEGWWTEIAAASNAQVQAYGAALGARYKDYDNIVWTVAGDYIPTATEIDRYDHIMIGIQGAGDAHLATAHLQRRHDGAESFNSFSWFTLNSTYTVDPNTIADTVTAYNRTTVRPTFLIEARYENFAPPVALAQIRREAWQQILAGGKGGHFFGNENIWSFNTDNPAAGDDTNWKSYLGDPGISHAMLIKTAFNNLTATLWSALAPDLTDTFLTSGESSGATQAAASFSTHAGVVYVATTGSIVVDLTEISGHATALCRWFDPTSGDYTTVGVISTSSGHTFTHPGANDAGDNDWALIIEGTQDASGTVAVTLDNLTSAASGTETITGTSAQTLANFTSSASGLADIVGTVARTLANFTSVASGAETITGTSAVTLQNFTSSASGLADVTGSVAVTLAAFPSAGVGTETFTGTSAQTLQNFTASAAGLADITGTVARTLAAFTGAASGSVTNPGSNGASVLEPFVGAATGTVAFTGTAAVTLANFSAAAVGLETITGTSAQTLANLTSTASGSETITGTVAVALANFAASAAGSETITGTVARTLANFICAATGTSLSAGGSAAITLQNLTATATGVVTNPPGGLGDRLPFDDNVIVMIGGSFDTSAIIGSIRLGHTVTGDDDTVLIIDRQAQRHSTFDEWTVVMP